MSFQCNAWYTLACLVPVIGVLVLYIGNSGFAFTVHSCEKKVSPYCSDIVTTISLTHLKFFHPGLEKDILSKLNQLSPDNYVIRAKSESEVNDKRAKHISVMSPAMEWHDGKLFFSCRVFVTWITDPWNKDYTYLQQFDSQLRPVAPPKILNFPATFHRVQDPRAFVYRGKPLLELNAEPFSKRNGMVQPTIIIFDINEDEVIMPDVPFPRTAEKNWMPLVKENDLYFVRTLDPLHVLKCDTVENCKTIAGNYTSNTAKMALRGGTPFKQYEGPYYISFAHSMFELDRKVFDTHIVVLNTDTWEVVFVSSALMFPSSLFVNRPRINIVWVADRDFFYPTSLMIENDDTVEVTGHVNDYSCETIRVAGMRDLMDKVMQQDRKT